MWGPTGLDRLFNASFGGQVSWLLPAALILLVAGLAFTLRRARIDRTRAAFLLWGGSLAVTALVFSLAAGIIHPYYTVALAPSIGALVGMGSVLLWRERSRTWARLVLAAAVAATSAWSATLLERSPQFAPGLATAVAIVGIGAAVAIVGLPLMHRRVVATLCSPPGCWRPSPDPPRTPSTRCSRRTPAPSRRPVRPSQRQIPAALVASRADSPDGAVVAGSRAVSAEEDSAAARCPQHPSPPRSGGRWRHVPRWRIRWRRLRHPRGAGGGGAGGGSFLNASAPGAALVKLLQTDASHYSWVGATIDANSAAGYQLATDDPIMAIGGFNGTDPAPSLGQFEQYVAEGRIHYFLGSGGGFGGGSGTSSQIAQWVEQHFTATTSRRHDRVRPDAARSLIPGRPNCTRTRHRPRRRRPV
jgi:4-amino-4-deoxy-L-arabinose transferase-like glycosyltransferase